MLLKWEKSVAQSSIAGPKLGVQWSWKENPKMSGYVCACLCLPPHSTAVHEVQYGFQFL